MDLSKAFDRLNHELLLTKLQAYGLDSNSVTFMKSYLKTDFNVVKQIILLGNGGKYLTVSRKDLF